MNEKTPYYGVPGTRIFHGSTEVDPQTGKPLEPGPGRQVEPDELEIRFAYHPAETREVRDAHAQVRAECLDLARWLRDLLPPCRETSQALEYVELATMKANAAIARRGLPARQETPGMTDAEAAEAALAGETVVNRVDDVPTGGKL